MNQEMPCIQADTVLATPWRNGGGRTRELFAWPPGPDWQLRVSLADIDADGPFSAFPGVQRYFAVLQGAGVQLTLAGQAQRLTSGDDALAFDGALAPGCELLAGPTRDLNLMLRGLAGEMHRTERPLSPRWPWRAVFCAGPALLQLPTGPAQPLAARCLRLALPPGNLRLQRLDAQPAFWLGAEIPVQVEQTPSS
jgi:hypothetical protein